MVSLDLVRTENRALALTCRRLLPIARAHTWFNCGATDQRTVKLLDLLLRRGFDGTLLRHMSFDAMDAAKLDDPPCTINLLPSPRSFPTFATSPSSPSSLFPPPADPPFQEFFVNSLRPLRHLVELELGGTLDAGDH